MDTDIDRRKIDVKEQGGLLLFLRLSLLTFFCVVIEPEEDVKSRSSSHVHHIVLRSFHFAIHRHTLRLTCQSNIALSQSVSLMIRSNHVLFSLRPMYGKQTRTRNQDLLLAAVKQHLCFCNFRRIERSSQCLESTVVTGNANRILDIQIDIQMWYFCHFQRLFRNKMTPRSLALGL